MKEKQNKTPKQAHRQQLVMKCASGIQLFPLRGVNKIRDISQHRQSWNEKMGASIVKDVVHNQGDIRHRVAGLHRRIEIIVVEPGEDHEEGLVNVWGAQEEGRDLVRGAYQERGEGERRSGSKGVGKKRGKEEEERGRRKREKKKERFRLMKSRNEELRSKKKVKE